MRNVWSGKSAIDIRAAQKGNSNTDNSNNDNNNINTFTAMMAVVSVAQYFTRALHDQRNVNIKFQK